MTKPTLGSCACVAGLLAVALAAGAARAQQDVVQYRSPTPSVGGSFGWSVSAVPDVNGDGRGDIVVGAQREAIPRSSHAGRVHIFSGSGGSLVASIAPPTPQEAGTFGWSVVGTPDLTGDGRGDVLVTGPWEADRNGVVGGRAYLYSGATGELAHAWVSPRAEDWGAFGWSVAWTPDINGDGAADVAVGAAGEDGGRGRVYLFSGAAGGLLRTLESPLAEAEGRFGSSVAGVSDMDGDGRGDVIVGAPGETAGRPGAGAVYIMSGATGSVIATFEAASPAADGNFGASVTAMGDLDGDAIADIAVGAPGQGVGGAARAGTVYVFSGRTGAVLSELVSLQPQTGGLFGMSIARTLDMDRDGRSEVVVGAEGEGVGHISRSGRAYVFSGGTGAILRGYTPPGGPAQGRFGFSVAGIGDTNGDGRGEVIIAAPFERAPGPARAGRVYLFR